MSDSYEIVRFLENLRQRGFDVTRVGPPGSYRVNRSDNATPGSTHLLILHSTLFDAYFDAAYATWKLPPGSIDRGEEILSLMAIQADAALTGGQVTEVGLRPGANGSIEWYRIDDREKAPGIDIGRVGA